MQPNAPPETIACGLFSKKEAAGLIAGGTRHIHSSPHASHDACAKVTQESLAKKSLHPYPWEQHRDTHELFLNASAQRYQFINQVIQRTGVSTKRDLKEKLESLLEELVTNSIYHAYQNADASPRYARKDSIVLSEAERITIRFASGKSGIFLQVSDQGGSFKFSDVAKSFGRCYGSSHQQIEAKEGGAGLGLYMSYEVTTHLKVVSVAGRETSISCWLADKTAYAPEVFSFNFFEWR